MVGTCRCMTTSHRLLCALLPFALNACVNDVSVDASFNEDDTVIEDGADEQHSHPEHPDDEVVLEDIVDASDGDEHTQPTDAVDDPLLPFDADAEHDGAAVIFAVSGCPNVRAQVGAGATLNIRPSASRNGNPVGQMQNGKIAEAIAKVSGESVNGSNQWYEIRFGAVRGFAHASYLGCTNDQPPIQQTCPRVRITASGNLNVRANANTSSAVRTQLSNGQIVSVLKRVNGESVQGKRHWFEIANGGTTGFVTGAYTACTFDAVRAPTQPPAADARYFLPLTCNSRVRIAQGNNGGFSHTGRSRFAYDFSIPSGTPMLAMKDGVVIQVYSATRPGHRCYNGGGSDCFPHANYVALRHPDGKQSIYKHLNRVDVSVGQRVSRGRRLGLSGSTGYSTGPHAHVMRQQNCSNALQCDSVQLTFADVPGNGIPRKDQYVTSQNCR